MFFLPVKRLTTAPRGMEDQYGSKPTLLSARPAAWPHAANTLSQQKYVSFVSAPIEHDNEGSE